MMKRHQVLGLGTDEQPQGLVYPVKYFDGQHFPAEEKSKQMNDFVDFSCPFACYKDTSSYVEFNTRVQQLAMELADMIQRAPACQDWPVSIPTEAEPFAMEIPRL